MVKKIREEISTDGKAEVLGHICSLVEERKREIRVFYSELNLRLPTYLKNATIQQLRDAGAIVDPDVCFPEGAEDHIIKYLRIQEKIKEVRESFKAQVIEYYTKVRKELPEEMLSKRLEDLSNEEWTLLGIDGTKMRNHYLRDKETN